MSGAAPAPPRVTVDVQLPADQQRARLIEDVQRGLVGPGKALPPVWFYDEVGSRLFEEITRQPEYYLTRTEREMLARAAPSIAELSGASGLVELGSGTSAKTYLLLNALAAARRLTTVTLLDISQEVLEGAAAALARQFAVPVHAVVGDFAEHLGCLPDGRHRLWAFLGSTIGNLTQPARGDLLNGLAKTLDRTDTLLLGTDLVKDPARLLAAYDDAAGVTAAFNRNLLVVLNRELQGNFDPRAFAHRAVWNALERRIEMRLRAVGAQRAYLAAIDLQVHFAPGEELLTEYSAKFTAESVAAELRGSGLEVVASWLDPDYLLTLARPTA